MREVTYTCHGGPETHRRRDTAVPEPGEGPVRLRVRARLRSTPPVPPLMVVGCPLLWGHNGRASVRVQGGRPQGCGCLGGRRDA